MHDAGAAVLAGDPAELCGERRLADARAGRGSRPGAAAARREARSQSASQDRDSRTCGRRSAGSRAGRSPGRRDRRGPRARPRPGAPSPSRPPARPARTRSRLCVVEVGLLADDDRRSTGARRLQPRGGVDHVAGDHRLAERGPRAERDDRLAGVDRDRGSAGRAALPVQPHDVAHDERRAHRALGVVAVRDRRAEDAP